MGSVSPQVYHRYDRAFFRRQYRRYAPSRFVVKGWYGAALALFTAVTIGVVPSAAKAAEVRLALAPRITPPS